MTHRSTLFLVLAAASLSLGGCSSVSKLATVFSEKKKADSLAHNPDQMRIATENVVFQPVRRVEVPQFNGLQTPLAGGSRLHGGNSAGNPIKLPYFTPINVLANNGRFALVQIKDGQRGYVPSSTIASEGAILANAKPATPVQTPGSIDQQALYLPRIDATDAPVDAAMLNNIDSIPLPESEKASEQNPEAHYVDGVLIRNAPPTPAVASEDTLAPAQTPTESPAPNP